MSRIEDEVCKKIAQRAEVGKSKYGVTMETAPLSRLEWLIHAQEEAMDLAVYLQKLIEMEAPIEEEESLPIKEAYEQITIGNSPVPVHKVLSQVIESHKVSMGEANKLLQYEKGAYSFCLNEGISMMQMWIHPNKEVKYLSRLPQKKIVEPYKRCEAFTTHGTQCTTPVHHDRPQYNNPHKPCKKEKSLCWQHCDCGAIHKTDNGADKATSPILEPMQSSESPVITNSSPVITNSLGHLSSVESHKAWLKAYEECTFHVIIGYGDGWATKNQVDENYMTYTGASSSTTKRHFNKYGGRLFNARKVNKRIYLQEKQVMEE